MKKHDGRSTIKQSQIDILEVLYKYRFGSRVLLAHTLSVNDSTLYKKLMVLVKYGLVGVKSDNDTKIKGFPAAYYLTPNGMRFLASLPNHEHITQSVVASTYKDSTVTQAFINQTLRIYAQGNSLSESLPSLRIFSRRDMSRYSYFPKPLPDAFLSLKTNAQPKRFFLDVIPDSTPTKPFYQRINSYMEFFDEGGWDVVSTEPPILLFTCETGATERRVRRTAKASIYKAEADVDIAAYTTTFGAIENLRENQAIWTSLDDPDELLALSELE